METLLVEENTEILMSGLSIEQVIAPTFWNEFWQELWKTFLWGNEMLLIGGGVLCFFRIISLIRVIKDANARSNNRGFQVFAVIMVLFLTPLFWLPLYIACRPQGWKWDKTLWRQTLLASLQECENCHSLNTAEHTCCVACGESLKISCRECGKWYSYAYGYCPFCWAPNIDKEG